VLYRHWVAGPIRASLALAAWTGRTHAPQVTDLLLELGGAAASVVVDLRGAWPFHRGSSFGGPRPDRPKRATEHFRNPPGQPGRWLVGCRPNLGGRECSGGSLPDPAGLWRQDAKATTAVELRAPSTSACGARGGVGSQNGAALAEGHDPDSPGGWDRSDRFGAWRRLRRGLGRACRPDAGLLRPLFTIHEAAKQQGYARRVAWILMSLATEAAEAVACRKGQTVAAALGSRLCCTSWTAIPVSFVAWMKPLFPDIA